MDNQRLEEIYKQLETSNVKLPKDAYILGPKYINELLALVHEKINIFDTILREVNRSLTTTKRLLLGKKRLKKIEYDNFLTTHADVKIQRSQALKEALVENMLKQHTIDIGELEDQQLELSALSDAVTNTLDNLRITRVDINRMINLMDLQIKLNSGEVMDVSRVEAIDVTEQDLPELKKQLKSNDFIVEDEEDSPEPELFKTETKESPGEEVTFEDLVDE